MIRKLRDFLKDESAATAIEHVLLAASIAVAILKAVKPANYSPACPICGRPTRFVRAIAKFGPHPELWTYECKQCDEIVMEEREREESGGRQAPLLGQRGRTWAEGLMVLRKKWRISNLDIVLVFGTWVGSIVFGWKHQPYWLAVPPVVFIGYMLFLVGSHSAWAAREPGLETREIFQTWKSAAAGLFQLRRDRGTGRIELRADRPSQPKL